MRYLTLLVLVAVGTLSQPAQAGPADPAHAPRPTDDFTCSFVQEITTEACNALVAFYYATNGPGWTDNTGWLSTDTPCAWFGIACMAGTVWQINLPGNNLSGSLPPEMASLSTLQQLDLSGNSLSGELPDGMALMTGMMWLNLSSNAFSGPLPSWLGQMTGLHNLVLSHNAFSGSIPPELGSIAGLGGLELYGNDLTGTVPAALGGLLSLSTLMLGDNDLDGPLPPALGNLTSLFLLDLSRNNFDGPIPSWITASLTGLGWLDLSYNAFSGLIPPELGSLKDLYYLSLTGNQLTGPIPATLGNIVPAPGAGAPGRSNVPTGLVYLYLNHNQLTGALPPELANLKALRFLHLNDNQLTGGIPLAYGGLPELIGLVLGQNGLSGDLPPELGDLPKLQHLYLTNNGFTGGIPPALGQLTTLTELSLGGNPLQGEVPDALASLTALRTLDLSNTLLDGPIPAGFTALTSLHFFWFDSTGLCTPAAAAFAAWLASVPDVRRTDQICADEEAVAIVEGGVPGPVDLGSTGVLIEFDDPSDDDGTLTVRRYDGPPANNDALLALTVETPGGEVVPDVVSSARYWTITATGLTDFDCQVCLDVSELAGVYDLTRLAIVHRANADSSWRPLSTYLRSVGEIDYICTDAVESFSQFGIASAAQVNPLPVELVAFDGYAGAEGVWLAWRTASETGNAGFDVEHRAGGETAFRKVGFVAGQGTTAAATAYRHRVDGLAPGRHAFRLRQVDYDGTFAYSPVVEVDVLPAAFVLHGAYPNPFNPVTVIALDLPAEAEVTAEVFDLLGRRVAVLAEGRYAAGRHGLRWDAGGVPSGTYLVRVTAGRDAAMRSVTVLR